MRRPPPDVRREMIGVQRDIRRADKRVTNAARALELAKTGPTSRRLLENLDTRHIEASSAVDALRREARILELELCDGWEPRAWEPDSAA